MSTDTTESELYRTTAFSRRNFMRASAAAAGAGAVGAGSMANGSSVDLAHADDGCLATTEDFVETYRQSEPGFRTITAPIRTLYESAECFVGGLLGIEESVAREDATDVTESNLLNSARLNLEDAINSSVRLYEQWLEFAYDGGQIEGGQIYNAAWSVAQANAVEAFTDGESESEALVKSQNAANDYLEDRFNHIIQDYRALAKLFTHWQLLGEQLYHDPDSNLEAGSFVALVSGGDAYTNRWVADGALPDTYDSPSAILDLSVDDVLPSYHYTLGERDYELPLIYYQGDGNSMVYEPVNQIHFRFDEEIDDLRLEDFEDDVVEEVFEDTVFDAPIADNFTTTQRFVITDGEDEAHDRNDNNYHLQEKEGLNFYEKFMDVVGAYILISDSINDELTNYVSEIYSQFNPEDFDEFELLDAPTLMRMYGDADGVTRTTTQFASLGYATAEEYSSRVGVVLGDDATEAEEGDEPDYFGYLFADWQFEDPNGGTKEDTLEVGELYEPYDEDTEEGDFNRVFIAYEDDDGEIVSTTIDEQFRVVGIEDKDGENIEELGIQVRYQQTSDPSLAADQLDEIRELNESISDLESTFGGGNGVGDGISDFLDNRIMGIPILGWIAGIVIAAAVLGGDN